MKGLKQPHRSPPTPPRQFDRRLTVPEIEGALHALLTAIEANEDRLDASRCGPVKFKLTPFSELTKTEPAVWTVEDLTNDPIGRSCREQVKALGRLLFRVSGSTDGMLETLDRVSDLNPARAGLRCEILDKWWNGIGNGTDIWTS